MIKGVAFDLEGTLVDLEFAHHQGHILAATEVNVELDLRIALEKIPHFIGGPDEEVAREIYQLSDKRVAAEEILNRTRFHYHELLRTCEKIIPRPGALDVIEWLVTNGFKIAIGSLTNESDARYLIQKSGLERIFNQSLIVLKEDVREVKPSPEVYVETARRMKIIPLEQIVFEDSPNGLKAANEAGSVSVGMPVIHRYEAQIALLYHTKRIFLSWNEVNISGLIENINREIAEKTR